MKQIIEDRGLRQEGELCTVDDVAILELPSTGEVRKRRDHLTVLQDARTKKSNDFL
jgi:hypothetical protein